jgi:hypothetical protein
VYEKVFNYNFEDYSFTTRTCGWGKMVEDEEFHVKFDNCCGHIQLEC